jgi:hypothetical protein
LKNYQNLRKHQINKAIKSLLSGKRGINVHLDKLPNPSKYVENWTILSDNYKKILIRGWQKEIQNGREQIEILKDILGN